MISAKWASKCPGCGELIEEGDRIGRVEGDWCCEVCVEDNGGEDKHDD